MEKNSYKTNTIFNTIKSVSGVIYPLITFPYISRVLLTDNVGKINYGNSIVSYVSLFASLGISTYATRECAKYRENRERLSKTASQLFSINVISTLFAYCCLILVLLFARPLENYRLLICIQSATVLFTTLGADWINMAMEDFQYIAIRTVILQLFSLILMFALVRKPEDYLVYAVISVIAASGANIINILYRKKFCRIRFSLDMNLREHFPHIVMLFSLLLSQIIFVNSDVTILGLIKGDHEVGLYSTAVKFYTIINTTIASITWVVMPKLTVGFLKKDYAEINRVLKYALNFILVLGVPCIFGLEILAPHLISLVAGEGYLGGTLALRILGISLLCSLVGGWVANMTRLPAGKEKTSLKISLVSAILNIVLNIWLIPKWGLNAAASTTAISELYALVCGIIVFDRQIQIDGLGKMLLSPLLGGCGIIVIGWAAQCFFVHSWMIVLSTICVSIVWYIVVLLIMKNEFFISFFEPAIRRIKGR